MIFLRISHQAEMMRIPQDFWISEEFGGIFLNSDRILTEFWSAKFEWYARSSTESFNPETCPGSPHCPYGPRWKRWPRDVVCEWEFAGRQLLLGLRRLQHQMRTNSSLSKILSKFRQILAKFWKKIDEFLLNFWDLSGAKDCKSCRSRKMRLLSQL